MITSLHATLKVGALLMLVLAGILLASQTNIGPGQPQSAEATNLSEIKKLPASDAEASNQFGLSVEVSGDTAAAGAYLEDAGGTSASAAYIFQVPVPTPTPTITSTATSAPTPTNTPTATETPTYTPTPPVDSRPNIVVIMTDDQDDMGSMSRMTKVTSLLADNGVTFENSFVDYPMCCPARASFLTGQAAHNHGIQDNVPPEGGYEKFIPS